MKDERKTKKELIDELAQLRRRVAELEDSESERMRAETALREKTHELGERVKELNCLYHISNLVEKPGISLEEILQGTVDLISPSWQYPEVTCARIILRGQEFRSENFSESVWMQADDIVADGERIGSLQVYYIEEKPESDEGPFLKEERSLLKAIVERLGRLAEHKRAETALQESEEKYRSMMEAMSDPVYICSPDFRVEYMNPAMLQRVGHDATGEPCHKAINDLDEKCPWCVHEKIQQGEYAETEIVSPRNGLSYQISHSPIFHVDGSISKMTIFTDITEHHRTEESLRDALGESQQRQAEVAGLLEGSRAVLKYREFKDAARSIFNSCKNLIGATAGYVALLSADGAENELVFLESGGLPCTVDPSLPMPIRGLREQAYRTGKAVYKNDFSHSKWMKFMPNGHANLDNVLFTPLVIEGKAVGLLGLANKLEGFTENDAKIASAFGEFASVALHNSRTWELLEGSEERFRSVAETANDAVISIDGRGNIIFWNDAGTEVFGYSADEVVGKPLTILMPERFREKHKKGVNRIVATGGSNLIGKTIEMAGLRKDGTEFPLELSLATWNTEEGTFFTGIVRDVTQRRKAEKALLKARDDLEQRVKERTAELQSLSSRLLDVQEDERKRIAGDLHDGIGQSLSTIKFSIESVLDRLEEETDPSTLDTLRSLVSMLQDSIEDVRNTVMNLRPSILDDLGILSTISWFFRQFQAVYSGIRVEEQIDVQETEMPDALKTNIFRVLQEATNNIAKHSKADRMRVALGKNKGAVELVIEDNGRGFDPRTLPTVEDAKTGFGITSMKERTELSGGSFSIESKKGAGTTVRASWPYRSE